MAHKVVLGFSHTCNLLGVNYCLNFSLKMDCTVLRVQSHLRFIRRELFTNNRLYCTRWVHSHLRFIKGELLHELFTK